LEAQHSGAGTGAGAALAPPVVHEVLRSPGQALDPATRTYFEDRFGHDFSRVRVHTDSRAEESARSVHALAFTVGNDIVMGAQQYSMCTRAGRGLLAHELVHVLQQSQAAASGLPGSDIRIGDPHGEAEREAEAQADRAVVGTPVHPYSVHLSRQATDPDDGQPAATDTQQDSQPAAADSQPTVAPPAAPTQTSDTATPSLTHYRFEIKAWIPFAHVPDPEEVLHEAAFRLDHPAESVDDYHSEYRGDAHAGYAGSLRVFQVADFDWDGSRITNVTFPAVPHFGTSHRDFSATLRSMFGFPATTRVVFDTETATTDHAVTGSQPSGQEVDLGMASPNPLTIFPAPDIDADYSFFISQDTFGIETVTVRWTTDFMPNHGFRVIRNGVVVRELIVNALPGPVSAPEIAVRLLSKSNGGSDMFEP
jgi:hypothetical protein